MIKITCDNCGAVKPEKLPATIEWILGYDLETETPKCAAVDPPARSLGRPPRDGTGRDPSVLAAVPRRVYEAVRRSHERLGMTDRLLLNLKTLRRNAAQLVRKVISTA
jgi:hypothetical protein